MKEILVNILGFFIAIFRYKKINWGSISKIIANSNIDNSVKIAAPCSIFNATIGFGSSISQNSTISYTTIGKFCSIGPNLLSGWGLHPTDGISTSPVFYSTLKQNGFTYSSNNKVIERKNIIIGNDVFIGANVTILDGITIGDGAIIGAGALVSKNIPPYAIAVGCPIKIIRYRFSEEIIDKLLNLKWWDKSNDTFLNLEKNFFNVEKFLEIEEL